MIIYLFLHQYLINNQTISIKLKPILTKSSQTNKRFRQEIIKKPKRFVRVLIKMIVKINLFFYL